MDRRHFLKSTSIGLSSLILANPLSVKANTNDHPDVITVNTTNQNISEALQVAFEQAYNLWVDDPLSRRPVIKIPAGQYDVADIVGNNRGNYPFHLPPTFKLMGAGRDLTHITSAQPRSDQYRFLMIMPSTRLDVINTCPTYDSACLDSALNQLGPSFNIEITGIRFHEFDNAISFKDSRDCLVHNCAFNSSLVAVQLELNSVFGNSNHRFEHCHFDARSQSGDADNFCLRFEAPFATVMTRLETGIQSVQECESLGGNANDYDFGNQSCVVPDDAKIGEYLANLFGSDQSTDKANRNCSISDCDFYHSKYSAIEFAGKLNIFNRVSYCGFNKCEGTGVEFDKGASFNIVENCVFAGLKPTTVFAPSQPYIFQAAVQEQEGSRSLDARIKSYIDEMGLAEPTNPKYLGSDIFLRSASLPQNNIIQFNQFDVSRSYWLTDYEPIVSKHAQLPDVYPSIKLSASLNTRVIGNQEFVSNSALKVDDTDVMGQSIVLYQNDSLRDIRGGVQILQNQFFGAWFVVGTENGLVDTLPLYVEDNYFGQNDGVSRGGISANHLYSQQAIVRNNMFYCASNSSSAIFRLFDIADCRFQGNTFKLPSVISMYIVSRAGNATRSHATRFDLNVIDGGHAMYIYDYSGVSNPNSVNDTLTFNQNTISNMSGSGRVIAVTLWFRNIEANSNAFTNNQDKTFQVYSLSDNFSQDGQNTLSLGANSQNNVYSRNYANTSGVYISNDFWAD
ncbi:hypothetical protein PN836_019210 [Ningiella sp. W23]|uniref:hypothetical protein n=1 Tax=Ningiella sp. W23 TaxID=3023715 RepID=UPI003756DDD7